MAIFRKRPLAAGCLMLILFTIPAYALPTVAFLSLIFSVLSIVTLVVLIAKRKLSYPRLYLLLLFVGVFLGSGRALLATEIVNKPLEAQIGKESAAAECAVEEISFSNAYSSAMTVSFRSVNGETASGKALLLLETAAYFREGDVISGSFSFFTLEQADVTYPNTYRAEGCVVALTPAGEAPPSLVRSGPEGLRFRMRRIQSFFADIVKTHVTGEEGNLLSALLLGARDELSDLTVRHFRRAGLSHLLALSGLHLGILAAILDRLFYMARFSKKLRMTGVFAVMLLYLLVTGFSYSMLRSVLMLAAVYLAFCLEENGDALTALALSGALILLITPYAIFSASYQMTMLATFGILAFSGIYRSIDRHLPRGKGFLRFPCKLLRMLISSVLISLAASVAVLPVQWLTFGEFSLVTPLTNLLLTPLAAPLLALGLLVLFAYPAPLFGWLARSLSGLLLRAVALVADTHCVISLSYDFVPYVLLPFFIIMLVLLIVDLGKRRGLILVPIPLVIGVFALCFTLHLQGLSGQLIGHYRPDGKNEGIVFYNASGSLMIDLSAGSATQLQKSWQLLQDEGETELDVLMLSHYHKAHVTAVSRFGKRVLVRSLWVPEPTTTEDEEILASLSAVAEELDIALTVFPRKVTLRVFEEGTLTLSAPLYEKRSTQPAFRLLVSYGDDALLYESAAYSEFKRHAGSENTPIAATIYIPGSHGPVPKENIYLETVPNLPLTVLVPNAAVATYTPWRAALHYVYFPSNYRFVLD